jgi:hypothetical protein
VNDSLQLHLLAKIPNVDNLDIIYYYLFSILTIVVILINAAVLIITIQ